MESIARKNPADAASHRGPSPLVVAVVYVVLFVASIAVPAAMAGAQHFPSPFEPAGDAARYFGEHAGAVRLAAFLQLGSAIPLGIFAASASSRVQFLGMKVAGIHIALFGGIAASVLQVLSASVEWVLAQPGAPGTAGVTHPLHLLAFAIGGPAYVATFGVLVAGLSVTSGLQGLAPRWVMVLGLGIAAVAEVSTCVLLAPAASILLPMARFSGFVWMICFGAVLPRKRREVRGRSAPPALAHAGGGAA